MLLEIGDATTEMTFTRLSLLKNFVQYPGENAAPITALYGPLPGDGQTPARAGLHVAVLLVESDQT